MTENGTENTTGPTRPLRNSTDRISGFARSFPSLRNAAGLTPWDPEVFARWATNSCDDPAALHAARFVLQNVWGHINDIDALARQLGLSGAPPFQPFDVSAALDAWDEEHREAFMRWTHSPFSD